jgi:hypothetical protein
MKITGWAVIAFGGVLLIAGFLVGYSVGRNQNVNIGDAVGKQSSDVSRRSAPAHSPIESSPAEKKLRERFVETETRQLDDGEALQNAYLKKLKRDYIRLDDSGRKGN